MLKITVNLFLFLFVSCVFSQVEKATLEVDYDCSFNSGFKVRKGFLFCNATLALYKLQSDGVIEQKKEIDEATNSIRISDRTIDAYTLINLESDTITSVLNIKKDDYKIVEEVPILNWVLAPTNVTKTIANWVCNKATVSFRGRNYTA